MSEEKSIEFVSAIFEKIEAVTDIKTLSTLFDIFQVLISRAYGITNNLHLILDFLLRVSFAIF